MKALFYKSEINGTVNGVPSKSYGHRAMILSYLSGSENDFPITCEDLFATKNCLSSIESGKLFCGESGSTLRFLLPVTSALGGTFEFSGKGRLMERPNGELLDLLSFHGVRVEADGKTIKTSGKLTGDRFSIRGDISSQFVSGLLMAMPLIGGGKVELLTPLSSEPYVSITLEVMEKFGVKVEKKDNAYIVPNINYKRKDGYKIPSDWSSSAFMLSLGAVAGKVCVKGLSKEDNQADRRIVDILHSFGAKTEEKDGAVTAEKGELSAIEISMDDCPDIVPVVSAVSSVAKGKTLIKGVRRLRFKESDRVLAIEKMLNSVGINARSTEDELIIEGGKIHGGNVETFSDHRIAMSAGVLGAVSSGTVSIDNAKCVDKSYPSFYEDYLRLGGKVRVFL